MKELFVFFVSLLAYSAFASESQKALISEAFNNFNESLVALEAQESHCSMSDRVLDANTFSGVKLSKEQKLTIIEYFYYDTLLECSKEALGQFLTQSTLLKSIEPDFLNTTEQANRLVISTNIAHLKAKHQFDNLDEHIKKRIIKPSEPFNLLMTANILGLN